MKTLLALLFIMMSANSFAYSSRLPHTRCSCVTELQKSLEDQAFDMNMEYKRKFNSFVKLDNDAEFLEGTNKEEAIVLIHGFIASPFEVRSVAKQLNEVGYTVYMPLLYGFGAYGEVANEGKLPIWKNQIRAAVKDLSTCFKKITIGGLSLGAALATDYVLTAKDPKITSLVIMAPYFDVAQPMTKSFVSPLSMVTESTSLSLLYTMSRSDDLIEILKNKQYYSEVMPYMTLQELFKFSAEYNVRETLVKSKVPVFLVYSDFDTTINLEKAESVPKKHFKTVNVYKLPKSLKVPHQITFAEANPKFDEMVKKIRFFILKSNAFHTN